MVTIVPTTLKNGAPPGNSDQDGNILAPPFTIGRRSIAACAEAATEAEASQAEPLAPTHQIGTTAPIFSLAPLTPDCIAPLAHSGQDKNGLAAPLSIGRRGIAACAEAATEAEAEAWLHSEAEAETRAGTTAPVVSIALLTPDYFAPLAHSTQ